MPRQTSRQRAGGSSRSDSQRADARSRPLAPRPAAALSGGAAVAAAAALLVALTLAAYLPALQAGFIWDDDAYVTANGALRSLDGLWRIWVEPGAVPQYYPLTFTSLWAEWHLWGASPLGYHLVNILLHALNALLLWRVLRALRLPGAWLAAAVFAVHPMTVESVAWITERKNVLSGLCFLSALLVYLRGLAGVDEADRFPWRPYLAVCVLFVGALLSKTVTCSLPAVLLLLTWWKRGTVDRRTIRMLAPLFVAGLGMALVTAWMEQHHVGAQGEEWALSFVERLLVAGRAFWFYPRTLLWPRSLTFIYPRWTIAAHAWWQYLFPAAAVAAVVGLYAARRRIGMGPLVATLCYAVALAPAMGFFNVYPMRYSFVADHFAYLPIIALIVLTTAAVSDLATRVGLADRVTRYAVCAPVLLLLVGLTGRQCAIYRDLRTLWTDTLAKNPGCWMAHTNLGNVLQASGQLEDAVVQYGETLRLRPTDPEAHYNLATALLAQGKTAEAITHIEQSLRSRPDFPEAHNNLGNVLQTQGALDDAVAQYTEALRLRPGYAQAHYNLGTALLAQGKTEEAVAHFQQALRVQPDYPEAHTNLGNAFGTMGKTEAAIAEYREAVRLRPSYAEADNNLGVVLAAQGQTQEAITHYLQALQWKPNFPEAQTNLGVALEAEGKTAEAISHFEAALRLKPDHAAAHRNLGLALARQGQATPAIDQLTIALRLDPNDAEAKQQLELLQRAQDAQ